MWILQVEMGTMVLGVGGTRSGVVVNKRTVLFDVLRSHFCDSDTNNILNV